MVCSCLSALRRRTIIFALLLGLYRSSSQPSMALRKVSGSLDSRRMSLCSMLWYMGEATNSGRSHGSTGSLPSIRQLLVCLDTLGLRLRSVNLLVHLLSSRFDISKDFLAFNQNDQTNNSLCCALVHKLRGHLCYVLRSLLDRRKETYLISRLSTHPASQTPSSRRRIAGLILVASDAPTIKRTAIVNRLDRQEEPNCEQTPAPSN